VRNAPGVDDAAMVNALPLRDSGPTFSFETSEPIAVEERNRLAGFRTVLGDYFGIMGIGFTSGRPFTRAELAGTTPAVIVDRAFERAYFPEGALGKEIEAADALRPIVGVVSSVPGTSPTAEPSPKMYVPLTPSVRQTMAVVASSSLAEAGALGALRDAVRAADEQQTIQSLLPMSSYRRQSLQQERLVLGVLSGMGFLALFLAALGTYGILSYLVSQRTQEIGVRMALGASSSSVRGLVLASGAKMVVLGLAVGVLLAAAGTRFLSSLLFETPTLDPVSFAAAGFVLVASAALAALLPALRATRVSPVEALRGE
jgi:ABC-type antimicrobial peptide transport system permease subunit